SPSAREPVRTSSTTLERPAISSVSDGMPARYRASPPTTVPHHTTKGVRPRIGGRTPFVSERGSVAGEAAVGHAVGARRLLTETLDLVGLVALEVALVPVPSGRVLLGAL